MKPLFTLLISVVLNSQSTRSYIWHFLSHCMVWYLMLPSCAHIGHRMWASFWRSFTSCDKCSIWYNRTASVYVASNQVLIICKMLKNSSVINKATYKKHVDIYTNIIEGLQPRAFRVVIGVLAFCSGNQTCMCLIPFVDYIFGLPQCHDWCTSDMSYLK